MTRSDTIKETPSVNIKSLHILDILAGHIVTSQLATIKSQVTGAYMTQKNTKKNETYVETGSKCATWLPNLADLHEYVWFSW